MGHDQVSIAIANYDYDIPQGVPEQRSWSNILFNTHRMGLGSAPNVRERCLACSWQEQCNVIIDLIPLHYRKRFLVRHMLARGPATPRRVAGAAGVHLRIINCLVVSGLKGSASISAEDLLATMNGWSGQPLSPQPNLKPEPETLRPTLCFHDNFLSPRMKRCKTSCLSGAGGTVNRQ